MGSDTSNVGAGSVDRSETVNLTLAGIVTQVLPNGNLVVSGHQQVRVNNEMRDLQIAGIVRTGRHHQRQHRRTCRRSPKRASPTAARARSPMCSSRAMAASSYDILMPF